MRGSDYPKYSNAVKDPRMILEDTGWESNNWFLTPGLFMHAFLIAALVTGSVVLFALGLLSVLRDLMARFSLPLELTLESPEDNEHDTDCVPAPWGAKDARL
jgi:hypothetical protein